MLWIGEPRTAAEDRAWWSRYLTGNIGRNLSPAQREEVARAEREFLGSKPLFNQGCIACGGSFDWIAAQSNEGRFWVCQKCHRPSTLTIEEWSAELAERRKEADAAAAEIAAASTPSATRSALRTAVAKRDQAQLDLRKLTAAADKAEDEAFDARRAVEAARAALANAEKVNGDAVRAAVLADAPLASVTAARRAAREALAAAEEGAEHANALAAALNAEVAEAKSAAGSAEWRVKRAVIACARAHSAKSIAAFSAETEALQAKLVARMRGLQLLVREGIIEGTEAREIDGFFSTDPRYWPASSASGQAEIAGRWQAAIDRLTRDATAPAELK